MSPLASNPYLIYGGLGGRLNADIDEHQRDRVEKTAIRIVWNCFMALAS
jgi:hypothetical protein